MNSVKLFAVIMTGVLASQVHAMPIFSPGDAILGGQSDGTNFTVGVEGTAGDTNNWPGGEPPSAVIDGVGQKYLNFGKANTGFIVTPISGPSVATNIRLWTANDEEPRDPASYELWGTNADVSGAGPFAIADFTAISTGDLALPASRNEGGTAKLLAENSQTIEFANTDSYASYMVVFPTLKDAGAANSMQIADVQLNIPEPTTWLLGAFCFGILAAIRRR